jgi:hypothetical protein
MREYTTKEFQYIIMQKIKIIAKAIYKHLQDNASLILVCTIIGIIHLLYQNYQFGGWNHSIQIPILKSYLHPELYPNDRMIETRSYFITLYFLYLAVIERIFGHLELIFLIAYLITEVLFFIAVYHFAYALFKDRNVAILAIILLFTQKLIIGGDLIHWDHHNHTHAVMPYILFALALFMKGHRRKAYGLLGFAANIHIQSVFYVVPMLALVSFVDFMQNRKTTGWRNGILALLKDYSFFVAFGLPCLAWAFAKSGGPFNGEWIAQLYERSKHHTFPFSWDKKEFTNYLLFFTLGILSWMIAIKNSDDKKIHRNFAWFTLVVLVFCGMAVVFSEYYPVKIILRIQLFRSTKFLTIFMTLYSCYIIKYFWDKNTLHKILAIGTFLALLLPEYLKFLVLLILLYQFAETKKLHWGVLAFASGVLVLHVFVPHEALPDKFRTEQITGLVSPLFEDKLRAILLVLLVFWLFMKSQSKRWLTYASTIIVCLVIIAYALPSLYHRVVLPYDKRGAWVDTQLWIKDNTPIDAMFITPPYLQSFRVFSERGAVAEWKDGTQQFFDTEYSFEWWERITDLGKEDKAFYENLSKERLLELCKKYNASYIVFPTTKKLDLPFVYENNEFRVYTLPKVK